MTFLRKVFAGYQCSGSVTFRYGSDFGFTDPCFWMTDADPDPDPALSPQFFAFLLTEGTFTSFFKDNKLLRGHKT